MIVKEYPTAIFEEIRVGNPVFNCISPIYRRKEKSSLKDVMVFV